MRHQVSLSSALREPSDLASSKIHPRKKFCLKSKLQNGFHDIHLSNKMEIVESELLLDRALIFGIYEGSLKVLCECTVYFFCCASFSMATSWKFGSIATSIATGKISPKTKRELWHLVIMKSLWKPFVDIIILLLWKICPWQPVTKFASIATTAAMWCVSACKNRDLMFGLQGRSLKALCWPHNFVVWQAISWQPVSNVPSIISNQQQAVIEISFDIYFIWKVLKSTLWILQLCCNHECKEGKEQEMFLARFSNNNDIFGIRTIHWSTKKSEILYLVL